MDRYLFRSFLASYVICFVSMVGLYVVIDLFANVDEFLEDHPGTVVFVRRACTYYALHSLDYFNRLSPIITLIAAMTTLASLHRNNEIVALLAAGVPTRRVLAPVMLGVGMVVAAGVANREFAIPACAEMLQRMHEDIDATLPLPPAPHLDSDQCLFQALEAHRDRRALAQARVTLPDTVTGGGAVEIAAREALWLPDGLAADPSAPDSPAEPAERRGGWLLVEPRPQIGLARQDKVRRLPDGSMFVASDVAFADMIQRPSWMAFASTRELMDELQSDRCREPQEIRAAIHGRIMAPAINFLLVLLGLPYVLQWERKNIFRSIAASMLLAGMFLAAERSAAYFAQYGYVDSMTAAWLPVFVFGPVAMALFHRVGT